MHTKEVYLPKRYSRLLIEETLRTRNTIIMFLCVGAVSQNFLLSMFFLYIDIYFACRYLIVAFHYLKFIRSIVCNYLWS